MNLGLVIILALFTIVVASARATEIDIGYDSRYISEGREQLVSGGIYWIVGSHEVSENVSLGVAYGYAANSNIQYDELNLSMTYANSVEGFDYYLAYTHLEFFEDKVNDDEISMGFSYTDFEFFTPFSNFVYGEKASGYFVDFGLMRAFKLTEKTSLTPYASIAFDFGYAAEGNEHNHSYIGLTISHILSTNANINVIIEKSYGGMVIRDEVEKPNQFWSGLHFVYSW